MKILTLNVPEIWVQCVYIRSYIVVIVTVASQSLLWPTV